VVTAGARGLMKLSRRPTRAIRGRYRMAALALLCLSVAVGSFAFKLHKKAAQWRTEAIDVRRATVDLVYETWPDLERGSVRSPTRVAETRLEAERRAGADFKPPPGPAQLFAEFERVVGILASHADDETVRVKKLSFDQGTGGELIFHVEDRSTATDIQLQLDAPEAYIRWTSSRGAPTQPQLKGLWVTEREAGEDGA